MWNNLLLRFASKTISLVVVEDFKLIQKKMV